MWNSMKKVLSPALAITLLGAPLCADQLDELNKETDRLWRRGRGAEDGAFTASYGSMIAWGVGIGAAAALLAILVESSSSSSSSSHNHCD